MVLNSFLHVGRAGLCPPLGRGGLHFHRWNPAARGQGAARDANSQTVRRGQVMEGQVGNTLRWHNFSFICMYVANITYELCSSPPIAFVCLPFSRYINILRVSCSLFFVLIFYLFGYRAFL